LEEVRLPQNVRDVVWRRIRRLDPDTQTLLRQASVLGPTFRFDDLQAMSGLSQWETLERLDMALERELVQEAPDDTVLRFSHSEIQHVLYADMGRWRHLFHRQAGEALERRVRATPGRRTEELAYHFSEAEELEKALGYSFQAARQAAAIRANPVARLWYNRALDIFESSEANEKRQLLSFLLQNCRLSGKNLLFELHSPFKTILEYAHHPTVLAWQDSFRIFEWEKAFPDPVIVISQTRQLIALS